MSKFSPERMSNNKQMMAEWLKQEHNFFNSITMDDAEADRTRQRDEDWPLFYVRLKRANGISN